MPNTDVTPDLPGFGGGDLNGSCNDLSCCQAMCDVRSDCGVFMFGSHNECPNCCWLKRAVAPDDNPSHLAGVTSYVKVPLPGAVQGGSTARDDTHVSICAVQTWCGLQAAWSHGHVPSIAGVPVCPT